MKNKKSMERGPELIFNKWMIMYMSERMKKGMEKRMKKRSRYMIG